MANIDYDSNVNEEDQDVDELERRMQSIRRELESFERRCGSDCSNSSWAQVSVEEQRSDEMENVSVEERKSGEMAQVFVEEPSDSRKRLRDGSEKDELPEPVVKRQAVDESEGDYVTDSENEVSSVGDDADDDDTPSSSTSKCPFPCSQKQPQNCNESIDDEMSDIHEALESAVQVENPLNTREKRVPMYRRSDILEVLPVDWVEITHSSGVPVYLHRPSRVCTFGRPYHLGTGSVRNHDVPLIAISCMHERRVNEVMDKKLQREKEAMEKGEVSLLTNHMKQSSDDLNIQLSADNLNEYATKIFRIKKIQVRHFRQWKETRAHRRMQREKMAGRILMHDALKEAGEEEDDFSKGGTERGFPIGSMIITAPSVAHSGHAKPNLRSLLINPIGKSAITILHEYCQKMLKGKVTYDYTELRSISCPYACTAKLRISTENRISIQNSIREKLAVLQQMEKLQAETTLDAETQVVGKGSGTNKKVAKLEAAKNALSVLVPGLVFNKEGIVSAEGENGHSRFSDKSIEYFDEIGIEEARVFESCLRTSVPTPYQLLTECISRNVTFANTDIKFSTHLIGHKKIQCDMEAQDMKVTVVTSNKKDGKQMCAQKLLQQIHPELTSYGSVLRLYSGEMSKHWDMVRQQKEVTSLQNTVTERSSANQAVLENLCVEMAKSARAIIIRKAICDSRVPVDKNGVELKEIKE